jgi:bifunctional DNase/RNase
VSDTAAGHVEDPVSGPVDQDSGDEDEADQAEDETEVEAELEDADDEEDEKDDAEEDADDEEDEEDDAEGDGTTQFTMALVTAVNMDLPNQHPTVVLRESERPRRHLSFSIGLADGVILSHAMRRIPTPRPLTHELLTGVLQGFDIDVVAVRLVGRQGAVYFAELDLRGRNTRAVYSCRPSDGLTIALLQPVAVPILIDRRLFEQAGDVAPPGGVEEFD